jgi:TonB family protein
MLEELFKSMDIRRNMIISFVLHVAVITTSFFISYKEESILPKYYMLASIVEEKATVTSTASSPIFPHQLAKVYKKGVVSPEPASNNTRFFSNTQIRPELKNSEPRNEYGVQNDMRRKNDESKDASANNKVGTTILVNQHVSLSEETNMSHSNTKENKSDPALPSENPPISIFNKGSQRGIEKGWGNGLPEQNTASKKIGGSRSVDEISESTKKAVSKNNKGLYALIRSAIERAKSYPLLAIKRRMEGTVLVSFKIDRKGFPGDIKIIKSSGYQILDKEVQKMLRKASPLPELSGEIIIPITFKLMESISNR